MALVKQTLINDLIDGFESVSNVDISSEDGREAMANLFATAIDNYIKSGTVNVAVVTAGSATAQTGTGVGTVS